MKRRLYALRFYLFADHGPATNFVVGTDRPCPGAARLVRQKLWRDVEPGEEVRFGMATYHVGAIALEQCHPPEDAGQFVYSGARWLAGHDSHPVVPPQPPPQWSKARTTLAKRAADTPGKSPG
jgi:hypothetical protein